MQKKIILFELNEVPQKVVDHFCKQRPSSTLARMLPDCRRHETYTEEIGSLSPWRTWPSLHRGVNDEKHMIVDFGQNLDEVDQAFPPIWKILEANGISTGLCGTLHSYPLPKRLEHYAFYIPDAFAAGSECFPRSIEAFQAFNLRMSRDSARNVSSQVPWQSAFQLLKHLPELGFKVSTAWDVGSQLVSERFQRWKVVRRRTYQSVVAFDVFMRQLQKTRPAFSSFFTNHVASSLHRYWAAAFPEDYEEFGYDGRWVKNYKSEIDFTMSKTDQFIARLKSFVDRNPEYAIWITTSMGQEATVALPLETQLYVQDLEKFVQALGVPAGSWSKKPAMLPQVNLVIHAPYIKTFREHLEKVEINGKPIGFRESEGGFFSIDLGHPNLIVSADLVRVDGLAVSLESVGLENVEIKDKSGASAYHIPEGCLFIYDPRQSAKDQPVSQVSTLDIAPAILQNYQVQIPGYMNTPALFSRN